MTRWQGNGLGDGGVLGGLWKHGTGVGSERASKRPSAACDGSPSLKGQVGSRDRAVGAAFEGILGRIDGRTEKATDAVNGVAATWSRLVPARELLLGGTKTLFPANKPAKKEGGRFFYDLLPGTG